MACLRCAKEFWLWECLQKERKEKPGSLIRNFCSRECSGEYKWWGPGAKERVRSFVGVLQEDGLWSGEVKRRWEGRWKLAEVRDPSRKGEAEAREIGEAAIKLARKYPSGNSHERRRIIIEILMKERAGQEALSLPDATARSRRDPEYRRVRKQVEQRLKRAYNLLGQPTELRSLL